jgi:hypothetical protein
MAWIPINDKYEFDNSPPDPGVESGQRLLWLKQLNGIRKFKFSEIYTKCRRIGSTIDTFGELSKTYYQGRLDFLGNIVGRTLITLDGVESNTHYRLAKPWSAAGNFEIEVDFSINNATTFNMILGKSGDTSIWLGVVNGGQIRLVLNGSAATETTLSYDDGVLHTLNVKRIGSTIEMRVDGLIAAPSATNANSLAYDILGAWNTGGFNFSGILSNVKLKNITTPANTLEFLLNELTQMYELPVNNVFGPELWDYGVISTDADINAYSTFAGDYSGNFEADECYVAEVSWTNLTGRIKFNAGDGNFTTDVVSGDTGSATFPLKFLSGGNPRLNVMELSGDHSKADAITMSVRKVSNFITYENIGTGNDVRRVYSQVEGTNDHISTNLVSNPMNRSEVEWGYNGGASYTYNNPTGSYRVLLPIEFNLPAGSELKVSWYNSDKNDLSGDRLRLWGVYHEDGSGVRLSLEEETVSINAIADGGQIKFARAGGSGPFPFIQDVANVSLQHIIRGA